MLELPAQERPRVGLGELITLTADRNPDKAAFLFPDGSEHSFAQTNARVNRLVSAFSQAGFAKGDRVAVFALDSHRYIETILAALKLGLVYVPLNYRLTRPEVDVLLERSEPKAIFFDVRYATMLDGIAERHPTLELVLELDSVDGRDSGYEQFLATGSDREPSQICRDDDIIAIAFTSGTTGLPKGVVQSQGMLKNINTAGMIEYLASPDDVRYCAAPTFHISGVCGLLMGIACGFTSLLLPQFDATEVLRFMQNDTLTGAFLVPTMISSIMQLPNVQDAEYERLSLITYGAAPITPSLLKRAMDTFDCEFLQAFGAGTEAGLQSVLTPADHRRALREKPELLKSAGRPSFGVAMRLVDDEMNDVPPGEVGEVATRSDMCMNGYLGMQEETERAFRDGWFRAGDMGYFDDEGYLYLHGRNKDMIIRGGENIYPIEIETVLAEHPAVAQTSVLGTPDDHWGESVRAFVSLRPGQSVSADELTAHCNERLARYKVPAEFIFMAELPTNASGKILKRELRKWEAQ